MDPPADFHESLLFLGKELEQTDVVVTVVGVVFVIIFVIIVVVVLFLAKMFTNAKSNHIISSR